MRSAAAALPYERVLDTHEQAIYRHLGLLVIGLIPALFWTGLLALGASTIGQPLSAAALATVGAAIATFLTGVAVALFARIS